ncbi:hypothetical protein WA026_014886 [Henosepilachna vigintioctopunctata]|uniref:Protein white n=1 Tax=Henosepilachna vigintioctopunctata TaxID=420089 RepID=A0AAW1V1Y9_9CUCU
MSENSQLLIEFDESENISESSNPDSDNVTLETGSPQYPSWRTDYGSLRTTELITVQKQLVYRWSNINAYGEQIIGNGSRNFLRFFSKAKKTRKHILKNVSGVAYPGELLVLMGASGAGKTTLLNCMTMRNINSLKIFGMISINDQPVTQRQLSAQSAYIQQDDIFIPWLTVREHLIFQALLRMKSTFTYREKLQRVNEVIGELSLQKCQNYQIGQTTILTGISGGERKRLALAAELLTNPSLLFCDEPTSGLDSFMSYNVIQILKAVAHTGRTVICTLHQPSSELFQIFDKVCLLSEGRTAFLGNPEEANIFFRKLEAPCPVNFNPADYYIQLLSIVPGREESCRQAVKVICDTFESSKKFKENIADVQVSPSEDLWSSEEFQLSPYKVSWCAQFRAVSWRSWLAIIRNPRLTKVRLIQVLFVSSLLSLLFWQQKYDQQGVQNINGALFLFLTNATFQNLIGVAMTFCGEQPLFLRENKNGMYRTDVYFISKILADIPCFTILNVALISICYICIGLNPVWPKIMNAIGIMLLVVYCVMGAGYFISSVAPNSATASSMVTVVVTPFLIFGGFLLNVESIPSYLIWLSDLSWFKYGNTALLINQWENVSNISCSNMNITCLTNGEMVLDSLGIKLDDFWVAVFALLGLTVLLRIISFLILLYKSYHYE